VKDNLIFFCSPQRAFLRIADCKQLRRRPVGKAPAGVQPMLKACETCTMYPLVDAFKVPTVTIEAYLQGSRPGTADSEASGACQVALTAGCEGKG
jgi:hypothetical protein